MSEKKFLGIHFRCCHVYGRLYVNEDGTAYQGRCPRCRRPVRVPVDPRGVDRRFLAARSAGHS